MGKRKPTELELREDVQFTYWDRKISRKLAAARLKDLGYEQWEVDLFLDHDLTGPE